MTPRERVWKAVNHEVPDRVPIDLGAMTASGIAASAYDKVKRMLGISTPTKLSNPCSMLAAVEDGLGFRLGSGLADCADRRREHRERKHALGILFHA